LKVCIECGNKTQNTGAKFCETCGESLLIDEPEEESNENGTPEDSRYVGHAKGSYSLGVMFEEFIQRILQSTGYDVRRRVSLEGKTGITHQINLVATRDDETIAVECKNCGTDKTVGIKELRDFFAKLADLGGIRKGMYVTNTSFSQEAELFARENNIRLWDRDRLGQFSLSLNTGRFGSFVDRKNEKRKLVLEMSLPLRISYGRATGTDIANPNSLKVVHTSLLIRPFY
jgi:hypothetical protein